MQPVIEKRAGHDRTSVHLFSRLVLAGFCSVICLASGQQSDLNPDPQQKNAPAELQTGAVAGLKPGVQISSRDRAVEVEGVVRVDIEVTGHENQAAHTLDRSDFTIRDDGAIQQIVAFRPDSPHQPVTIILLIDTLGIPNRLALFERTEVAKFLRLNGGHLGVPVAIYSLANRGFSLVARPSQDGNTLAEDVNSEKELAVLFEPRHTLAGFGKATVDQTYAELPLFTALRAIGTIAATENDRPEKKLLLWIGPGLLDPSISSHGTGQYPTHLYGHGQQQTFGERVWAMTLMRQARVSIYAFSVGEDESDPATNDWKDTLALPPSAETTSMDLYKKVLAVRTGGRVLAPEEDLARQIEECVAGIGVFYSVTFNPPLTTLSDDYHSIEIEVSNPTLTVHTVSGYFDQPFYQSSAEAQLRLLTVAELEQLIEFPTIGAKEPLSSLALTERLSDTKQAEIAKKLHGNEQRAALQSIADLSAFLPPPSSVIPSDPPPDALGQEKILIAVEQYLDHTIPKLPDFFGTRRTVRYGETPAYEELSLSIKPVPLHVEERSKATVLYRDGQEIVDVVERSGVEKVGGLSTYGTFGPLLRTAQIAIKSQSDLSWSRWEQDKGTRVAIFQFRSPTSRTTIRLTGGGLPYGASITAPYHGEIAVDPGSGEILRLQVQSDLPGFVPVSRSDMMVIYGPVEIDGRRYVVPLRSVSVMTARTVPTLNEWNVGFQTWGPLQTRINEFTFDHYHMFRSTSRILPDYTELPR